LSLNVNTIALPNLAIWSTSYRISTEKNSPIPGKLKSQPTAWSPAESL